MQPDSAIAPQSIITINIDRTYNRLPIFGGLDPEFSNFIGQLLKCVRCATYSSGSKGDPGG